VERGAAEAASVVAAAASAGGAEMKHAARSNRVSLHDCDMLIPRLMLTL
jgi:hypothetical protein